MKIILPWPDYRLNPNQSKGHHWSVAAGLRKVARDSAFWIAREAMVANAKEHGASPFADRLLPVRITFLAPTKQARDLDNLLAALKPSLDGIADCLGTDDSKFDPITITRGQCGAPGSVEVEIA